MRCAKPAHDEVFESKLYFNLEVSFMKALECEKCGSNELEYVGGIWVCSHCGTKFIPDKDERPNSKDDELLQLYLDEARRAIEWGSDKAYKLARKAVKASPRNVQAWVFCMQAVEYDESKDLYEIARIQADAGKKAIEYSENTELYDQVRYEVYDCWFASAKGTLKAIVNEIGRRSKVSADVAHDLGFSIGTLLLYINGSFVANNTEFGPDLQEHAREIRELMLCWKELIHKEDFYNENAEFDLHTIEFTVSSMNRMLRDKEIGRCDQKQ